MNNSYDISDMNQNMTDKVGSAPNMDPKGTTRKGPKEEFSLQTKHGSKNPFPPFSKEKVSHSTIYWFCYSADLP